MILRNKFQIKDSLKTLLASQSLAVLATQNAAQPYANLVAFAAAADLKSLFFATARSTRKFANISKNPRVSLVIDNRSNRVADFREAMAVTALGKAKEIGSRAKKKVQALYLSKHPYLREFVLSPSCALLKVEVEKYIIVYRFQNVLELNPRK